MLKKTSEASDLEKPNSLFLLLSAFYQSNYVLKTLLFQEIYLHCFTANRIFNL